MAVELTSFGSLPDLKKIELPQPCQPLRLTVLNRVWLCPSVLPPERAQYSYSQISYYTTCLSSLYIHYVKGRESSPEIPASHYYIIRGPIAKFACCQLHTRLVQHGCLIGWFFAVKNSVLLIPKSHPLSLID